MSFARRILIALSLVAWLAIEREATRAQEIPREGLILWLDASDLNTLAPGAPVAAWPDKSPAENHVEQDDASRRPSFHPEAIGGRPAVRFHGQELLDRRDFRGLASGDGQFHILVVMRAPPDSSRTAQRLVDLQSREQPTLQSTKRGGFWLGQQAGRGKLRLGIQQGDEGEGQAVAWDGQPHLVEAVYAGEQTFALHQDGTRQQRALFNGTHFLGFQTHVTLAIGQHFALEDSAATFFEGDLAEVLIYDRPLTASERFHIGSHLAGKYGLATAFRPIPRFEQDVAPVLAQHCHHCHGAETREAELDLRTVASMLSGGKAGPVIVRGFPDRSELIVLIETGKMPPDGEPRLNDGQIQLLRDWVEADAPAREQVAAAAPPTRITTEHRAHWAFQRLAQHAPPEVMRTERVRNDVDRFALARLEERGLTLSPEADRTTLIRRLYFDLIGLPPSPDEIESFVNDPQGDAYERLVDRLLDSEHYGERWGRYWLDVAGYVDVYGSDNDFAIIKPLEGKWRYRDYVVQAFNQDKPFDRFVVEQLAGDELYDWRAAEHWTPEMLEALTATGFLLCANDDTDQNELNTPDIRHHVWQRTTEIVAGNLLAMTLMCAKCHDHKYEPISQTDYYQLEAVFAGAFNVRNWLISTARGRPDVSDHERGEIDARNAAESTAQAGAAEPTVQGNGSTRNYQTIQVVWEPHAPAATYVLRRGDYLSPGLEVGPALLSILCESPTEAPLAATAAGSSSGRRLALARRLTDADAFAGQHVARVWVNRVWQQLFGRGLVATSDNLGLTGSPPTHPELLDWLTRQFLEGGWRTKPLVKLLVTSSTYRQQSESLRAEADSAVIRNAESIDPQNDLLWRMRLRRLDSELVRDAILAVSGKLQRAIGGPPLLLDAQPSGMVRINEDGLPTPEAKWRRSLYVLARRNYHLTMLEVFDQPAMATHCTVRQPAPVVTQSLTLLHDDFVIEQAGFFAERSASLAGDDQNAQIATAFRLALGRLPTQEEILWCGELLQRHAERYGGQSMPAEEASRKALAQLCHVLLNTSEFLYVR